MAFYNIYPILSMKKHYILRKIRSVCFLSPIKQMTKGGKGYIIQT